MKLAKITVDGASRDATGASALDLIIEREIFDLVARGLPEGFAFGILPLALTAILMPVLTDSRHLLPWVIGVGTMLALGLLYGLLYQHHADRWATIGAWRRVLHLQVGMTGLAWGTAGWLFVPAPWQAEMYVLTMLACLSAVVLANIGASLSLYLCFIAGVILPSAIHRIMLGGVMNLALCVGALATILALTVFSSRLAKTTRRSLRIAHENRLLARALEQRTLEAEQANLDKSRFIAAASHDLRQPVHALGLLLDALQEQSLGPRAAHTAQRMASALGSLESLFTGLLDISRIDSGEVTPKRTSFPLGPVLSALVDEYKVLAQAKGIRIQFRATDLWAHSDPMLLERVLRNLIANAVRYTMNGGVLIGCRWRSALVRIEVWDSGIGIAPTHKEAVFAEYFQVSEPAHGRERGLGLGLAIVRRLCLLLDHPVEVQSRPGRGSVFRVSVPISKALKTCEADRQESDSFSAIHATWPGRNALVVDQDAGARDAMSNWLSTWGCQVNAFEDTPSLWASLKPGKYAPDVLIADWHLPGGEGGLGLSHRIRRIYGDVSVILITADTIDDARRYQSEHNIVLLHKPVRPAVLRAALGALWANRVPHGQRNVDDLGTTSTQPRVHNGEENDVEREHEDPDR